MPSSFAFVYVVRERVRPQSPVKALECHLRYGCRSTGGIIGSSNSTCAAVSGNPENGR